MKLKQIKKKKNSAGDQVWIFFETTQLPNIANYAKPNRMLIAFDTHVKTSP